VGTLDACEISSMPTTSNFNTKSSVDVCVEGMSVGDEYKVWGFQPVPPGARACVRVRACACFKREKPPFSRLDTIIHMKRPDFCRPATPSPSHSPFVSERKVSAAGTRTVSASDSCFMPRIQPFPTVFRLARCRGCDSVISLLSPW